MTALTGAPRVRWSSRRLPHTLMLVAVLLLAPLLGLAQGLLPVPELRARVMDQTGTLDPAALAAIEERLASFEKERGAQVVVLVVASTAPEDIADFTQRVGDAWKIGRQDVGDGLLFVVAKDDRRMRIAPAKSLEGAIPDLAARRILDQAVAPAFRQGDYAGGIRAGLERILALISGEALPMPTGDPSGLDETPWQDLLIFAVFALPIVSVVLRGLFGNKLGSLLTGGAAAAMAWHLTALLWITAGAALIGLLVGLVMQAVPAGSGVRRTSRHDRWGGPNGGWSGGGGGWGGGGFGSGGGGDFGGGGASGDW